MTRKAFTHLAALALAIMVSSVLFVPTVTVPQEYLQPRLTA